MNEQPAVNRAIETILRALFHFDGYLVPISLKKPSFSRKHLRMLFVGVGQVTDDQWFCYSGETLSQKKLRKWPNIFQSLQPVQVIQDTLCRAFAESLARAIRKLGFELVRSHRNFGPAL